MTHNIETDIDLIHKDAREWTSHGSDIEIEETKVKDERPLIGIRLDTATTQLEHSKNISDHNPELVKHGYVSFLPKKRNITVERKRVDFPVEASSQVHTSLAQTSLTAPADVSTQYNATDIKTKKNDDEISAVPLVDVESKVIEESVEANKIFNLYIDDYPELSTEFESHNKQTSYYKNYECFVDIDISKNKIISCTAFHPFWTDVVALAYAKNCLNDAKQDESSNALEIEHLSNIVLGWNLTNSAAPAFVLSSAFEVSALAFSQHCKSWLLAGCVNGQIIMWDLHDKIRSNSKEVPSKHTHHLTQVTIAENTMPLRLIDTICPFIISPISCHLSSIIHIQWLSAEWKVLHNGNIERTETFNHIPQVMSCSENGIICLWDISPNKNTNCDEVLSNIEETKNLLEVHTDFTNYQPLSKTFILVYKLLARHMNKSVIPLSSVSFNDPYSFKESQSLTISREDNIGNMIEGDVPKMKLWLGTTKGTVVQATWQGTEFNNEETVNEEVLSVNSWEEFHDGPVTSVCTSPFIPDMFFSTGGKVLAIWTTFIKNDPLVWRKLNKQIRNCAWSADDPGEIYICFQDGSIKLWNILKNKEPSYFDGISSDGCTGLLCKRINKHKSVLCLLCENGIFKVYTSSPDKHSETFSVSDLQKLIYEQGVSKMEHISWFEEWKKQNKDYLTSIREIAKLRKEKYDEEVKQKRRQEIERKKAEEKSCLLQEKLEQKMTKEEKSKKRWFTQEETYITNKILKIKYLDQHEIFMQQKPIIVLQQSTDLKLKHLNEIMERKSDIYEKSISAYFSDVLEVDSETRCNFERSFTSNKDVPTVEQLITFLEKECLALEASGDAKKHSVIRRADTGRPITFLASKADAEKCVCCDKDADHRLHKCSVYLKMKPIRRKQFVMTNRLCFNCLSSHTAELCTSEKRCHECKGKHHTTLHIRGYAPYKSKFVRNQSGASSQEQEQVDPKSHSESTEVENFVTGHTVRHIQQSKGVVLSTVVIGVQNGQGKYQLVRAVLDTGSQSTYITTECARRLRLPRYETDIKVLGLGQNKIVSRGGVSLHISHRNGGTHLMTTEAVVIDKITGQLPTIPLPVEVKRELGDLTLADPNLHIPGPIDCLLGADVFAQCLQDGRMELGAGKPTVLNTIFGWVLMGCMNNSTGLNKSTALVAYHSVNVPSVDSMLQKFWTMEEPVSVPIVTAADKFCENHYVNTHTRKQDGSYVVKLPFKLNSDLKLGVSYGQAESRFLALERRLVKTPDMYNLYRDCMQDYISAGHMEECEPPSEEQEIKHYFMPHHGVYKSNSSTTKLRVVFDASSPTTSNSRCSLNEILVSGPKLHKDLIEILIHFRLNRVAMTADVKQMYRRVWVDPADRNYQLILWRNSNKEDLKTYRLNTVTFGVTSSPFLAMRSLLQLVKDEGSAHPLAAKALSNDIFVDDVVTGAPTVQECLELQDDLIKLLSKGSFQLRKWASNEPAILSIIPEEDRETPVKFISDEPLHEVLGIGWHTRSDSFVCSGSIIKQPHIKRGVLSSIARFYDPLGLLTPVTLWAKAMLQKLWIKGLDWDTPLPLNLLECWARYEKELPELSNISFS